MVVAKLLIIAWSNSIVSGILIHTMAMYLFIVACAKIYRGVQKGK